MYLLILISLKCLVLQLRASKNVSFITLYYFLDSPLSPNEVLPVQHHRDVPAAPKLRSKDTKSSKSKSKKESKDKTKKSKKKQKEVNLLASPAKENGAAAAPHINGVEEKVDMKFFLQYYKCGTVIALHRHIHLTLIWAVSVSNE